MRNRDGLALPCGVAILPRGVNILDVVIDQGYRTIRQLPHPAQQAQVKLLGGRHRRAKPNRLVGCFALILLRAKEARHSYTEKATREVGSRARAAVCSSKRRKLSGRQSPGLDVRDVAGMGGWALRGGGGRLRSRGTVR